jgi:hypothetical protein
MRVWWMLGATAAAVLAVVFAVVGDGVRVVVDGRERFIRETGHWLTWALLALGLGLAAALDEWTGLSRALCVVAAVVYVVFVLVVVRASGRSKRVSRRRTKRPDEMR